MCVVRILSGQTGTRYLASFGSDEVKEKLDLRERTCSVGMVQKITKWNDKAEHCV